MTKYLLNVRRQSGFSLKIVPENTPWTTKAATTLTNSPNTIPHRVWMSEEQVHLLVKLFGQRINIVSINQIISNPGMST